MFRIGARQMVRKPVEPSFRRHAARMDVTKSLAVDIRVRLPNEGLRSASAERNVARDWDASFGTDESQSDAPLSRRAEAVSICGQQDHHATGTVTNADQVRIGLSFFDANSFAFAFG